MRFLKNKIALAQAHKIKMNELRFHSEDEQDSMTAALPISHVSNRRHYQENSHVSDSNLAKKNIVKNYGKAICRFASSELATPYLTPLAENEKVSVNEFLEYVLGLKKKVDGLFSFRAGLLQNKDDNRATLAFKSMLQKIGEIFIKYFSVNWIFHGKLLYKQTYLKYRFKMLRRIKKPEFFTSLQSCQIQRPEKNKNS